MCVQLADDKSGAHRQAVGRAWNLQSIGALKNGYARLQPRGVFADFYLEHNRFCHIGHDHFLELPRTLFWTSYDCSYAEQCRRK